MYTFWFLLILFLKSRVKGWDKESIIKSWAWIWIGKRKANTLEQLEEMAMNAINKFSKLEATKKIRIGVLVTTGSFLLLILLINLFPLSVSNPRSMTVVLLLGILVFVPLLTIPFLITYPQSIILRRVKELIKESNGYKEEKHDG